MKKKGFLCLDSDGVQRKVLDDRKNLDLRDFLDRKE